MPSLEFTVPIKTVSELNISEHWTKKSKRHRAQQLFIRLAFREIRTEIGLPCVVDLIRISPRVLDYSNLVGALKWVQDEVSELLIPEKTGSYVNKAGKVIAIKGRADNDPRITWNFKQEKGKMGVKIRLAW